MLRTMLLVWALAGCGDADEIRSTGETTALKPLATRPDSTFSDADRRALEALGYVATAPTHNPEARGVTLRSSGAYEGLSLYASRRAPRANLVDMDGHVVHRWSAEAHVDPPNSWMHVEPQTDGSLIVVATDRHVAKLAWDSTLVWKRPLRAHHDVAVRSDGSVLALARSRRDLAVGGAVLPVLGDAVVELSPDGTIVRRVELVPLMRSLLSVGRLERLRARLADTPRATLLREGGVGDVLHANAVTVLTRDVPGVAPSGSIAISFRAIHRVVIFDAAIERVLWEWGHGELQGQHDVTQLDDGNLLVFDNGVRRRSSRVVEIDPRAREVVTSLQPTGLFTRLRGGAQRLPNGNTLVTESDSGHALEVDVGGRVVWEFWNPDVEDAADAPERGVIYRMNRFPSAFFAPLAP